MKQILFTIIMAVALLPSMLSCSRSNDDEPKRYATESEIQGKWGYIGERVSYVFEFNNGHYSIIMKSGSEIEYESGSYTMGANGTINLTPSNGKTSPWSPLEAYWEDSNKIRLYFWPIGPFIHV